MQNNRLSTHLDNLERRKAGRVRCQQTICQLGPLADLSRDGCRVISKEVLNIPRDKSVNLRITAAGITACVPAQQVSCRARKDRKFNVGFRFVAVPEQARRQLTDVLRAALCNSQAAA